MGNFNPISRSPCTNRKIKVNHNMVLLFLQFSTSENSVTRVKLKKKEKLKHNWIFDFTFVSGLVFTMNGNYITQVVFPPVFRHHINQQINYTSIKLYQHHTIHKDIFQRFFYYINSYLLVIGIWKSMLYLEILSGFIQK